MRGLERSAAAAVRLALSPITVAPILGAATALELALKLALERERGLDRGVELDHARPLSNAAAADWPACDDDEDDEDEDDDADRDSAAALAAAAFPAVAVPVFTLRGGDCARAPRAAPSLGDSARALGPSSCARLALAKGDTATPAPAPEPTRPGLQPPPLPLPPPPLSLVLLLWGGAAVRERGLGAR